MISSTPKIRYIKPENRLRMLIFLSVSLLRRRPARLIFSTSADIFNMRQIEKITSLSSKVFDKDFVAAANHNVITPGFSVLIRNPVIKSPACVALLILMLFSASGLGL